MTATVLQTVQILETEIRSSVAFRVSRSVISASIRSRAVSPSSDAILSLRKIYRALAASIIKRTAVSVTIRSRAVSPSSDAILSLGKI